MNALVEQELNCEWRLTAIGLQFVYSLCLCTTAREQVKLLGADWLVSRKRVRIDLLIGR